VAAENQQRHAVICQRKHRPCPTIPRDAFGLHLAPHARSDVKHVHVTQRRSAGPPACSSAWAAAQGRGVGNKTEFVGRTCYNERVLDGAHDVLLSRRRRRATCSRNTPASCQCSIALISLVNVRCLVMHQVQVSVSSWKKSFEAPPPSPQPPNMNTRA
jgi:hypothetical protein